MPDYTDPLEKARGKAKTDDPETQRSRDLDDYEDKEESGKQGDLNLPLPQYTKLAAEYAFNNAPEHGEDWRSSTWDFVRLMKAHPDLRRLSAEQAMEKIPWGVTDFEEEEQVRVLVEWDRVKYLPGQGPIDIALSLAGQKPLASKRKLALYDRFISLAGWLQVCVGEGQQIYLPLRKTAKLLGCSKETISSLRALAVKDGFLKIAAPHTSYRATRFVFDIGKFPILREWRH